MAQPDFDIIAHSCIALSEQLPLYQNIPAINGGAAILARLDALANDMAGLRNDVTGIRNDITDIRNDITGIRIDIMGLRLEVGARSVFPGSFLRLGSC